jgi:transcriptional regulator with XRE-family HTH domain
MLCNRLNKVRKQRGLTAQQMADALQTGLRNYRKYESGDAKPTLDGLVQIADILDVSTDYLLCRDEFLAKHVD